MKESSVFVVTVTYGDRRNLLEQTLAATISEGILDIVVVTNGVDWSVEEFFRQFGSVRAHIVTLARNRGSAVGFAAGIRAALDAGAESVWLLDDDTKPEAGTLKILVDGYWRLRQQAKTDHVAVRAYRSSQNYAIAFGMPKGVLWPRESSFLGFHIADLPQKVARRFLAGSKNSTASLPEVLFLRCAPYGGLLLGRKTIEQIGLPRADFVLYGDDGEWTLRIIRAGGCIGFLTKAQISDLEVSWGESESFGSYFSALLNSPSDFRVYYSVRNETYISAHCLGGNSMLRAVNKVLFSAGLWLASRFIGRPGRYGLLLRAIAEGCAGRLGENPEYPLRQFGRSSG